MSVILRARLFDEETKATARWKSCVDEREDKDSGASSALVLTEDFFNNIILFEHTPWRVVEASNGSVSGLEMLTV